MKESMDRITNVTDKICAFLSYFSMIAVVFMMLMICVDVVLGNFLGNPIAGMYELCQVILTTVVFTSWAYTQTVHGHIHVVMFVSKMPQKLRFICFGLTSIFSTVVMGIATYGAYLSVLARYKSGECTGTLLIPYWPFNVFMMFAFGLLTIVLLLDSIKAVLAIGNKELAADIQASWV
jgi:TRAP-type C4-dicarboxylate transport system permease small subunit